jgi:hypothetical protein
VLGYDSEQLFGEEHLEHPPNVRCGCTVDSATWRPWACKGSHVVEPCFNMRNQRRSSGQA